MTHTSVPAPNLLLLLSVAALVGACDGSPPATDGGSAMRDGMVVRDGTVPPDTGPVCAEAFEPCTTRADCCGELYCGASGCQESVCADGPAACTENEDCCSGACVLGEGGTSGTCGAPGCLRDRDPLTRCTSDGECCSGHCNTLFSYCQATACVDDDATCTTNEECCSERCRIVSGTRGTCTSSCSSMNGPCEVDIDCCFSVCNGGICRCEEPGRLCRSDRDCCSGTCMLRGSEGLCE